MDKMIQLAKVGTLHAKRQVRALLCRTLVTACYRQMDGDENTLPARLLGHNRLAMSFCEDAKKFGVPEAYLRSRRLWRAGIW